MTDEYVCQNCEKPVDSHGAPCKYCYPERYDWFYNSKFCPWKDEDECQVNKENCEFYNCGFAHWRED